jgi:ArsR family transcriptional regulator, virulence genes transcriptional regulator
MDRKMNLQVLIPKAAEAERFVKALANAHRLMILCELHRGELSVTPLQAAVGLSQSSLSQHLARLRKDSLVKTRREAQTIYYSLADDKAARTIALLYDLFCRENCVALRKRPASAVSTTASRRAKS